MTPMDRAAGKAVRDWTDGLTEAALSTLSKHDLLQLELAFLDAVEEQSQATVADTMDTNLSALTLAEAWERVDAILRDHVPAVELPGNDLDARNVVGNWVHAVTTAGGR